MAHHQNVSLAEVLFAVLVLGLLAAVALPPMVYSADARISQCRANVVLVNRRIERYAAQHGGWTPADQDEFARMMADEKTAPRGSLPKCPFGQPYVYDPGTGRLKPHRH